MSATGLAAETKIISGGRPDTTLFIAPSVNPKRFLSGVFVGPLGFFRRVKRAEIPAFLVDLYHGAEPPFRRLGNSLYPKKVALVDRGVCPVLHRRGQPQVDYSVVSFV